MNGLDMKIQRFNGLVIDKSTAFQTICQTKNIINKYYQTRISPNHVYGLYGYIGYRGYRGLSIYRRIPPIPHSETLNVSNNNTGGYMGGYIKNTKPFIGHITHIRNKEIYGLMV